MGGRCPPQTATRRAAAHGNTMHARGPTRSGLGAMLRHVITLTHHGVLLIEPNSKTIPPRLCREEWVRGERTGEATRTREEWALVRGAPPHLRARRGVGPIALRPCTRITRSIGVRLALGRAVRTTTAVAPGVELGLGGGQGVRHATRQHSKLPTPSPTPPSTPPTCFRSFSFWYAVGSNRGESARRGRGALLPPPPLPLALVRLRVLRPLRWLPALP